MDSHWKEVADKIMPVLPEEAKKHQWQKYPDLLANRLQDALVRGPEAIEEWVAFFGSMFGYKLNPLEVSIGAKPPYPCAAIVVPKDEMAFQKWEREKDPANKCSWGMGPLHELSKVEVYKKCLDIFPYDRHTSHPEDYWNSCNYFNAVKDVCKRPEKPYLIWAKIPDFHWNEERKVTWEQRWDSPGTTFLEQMLLDLFWWDKYKTPFAVGANDNWKRGGYGELYLCNGSEFIEDRWPDKKYYKEFCGVKRLIPTTGWTHGWHVGEIGYKTATTPSPLPCVVTF